MTPARKGRVMAAFWLVVAIVVGVLAVLAQSAQCSTPSLWSVSRLQLLSFLGPLAIVIGGLWQIVSFWRRRGWLPRSAAIAILISLAAVAVWFQRYTDLGVFALRGSDFWITAALKTDSEACRSQCLKLVLSATQYGGNIAENSVKRVHECEDRQMLFTGLATAAEGERLRDRFLALATQACD